MNLLLKMSTVIQQQKQFQILYKMFQCIFDLVHIVLSCVIYCFIFALTFLMYFLIVLDKQQLFCCARTRICYLVYSVLRVRQSCPRTPMRGCTRILKQHLARENSRLKSKVHIELEEFKPEGPRSKSSTRKLGPISKVQIEREDPCDSSYILASESSGTIV